MRFRIYYDNEETYSGDPFQARGHGVIAIAEKRPGTPGYAILGGSALDYFMLKDGQWFTGDIGGLFDYIHFYLGQQKILDARHVRDDVFFNVMQRALREGLG